MKRMVAMGAVFLLLLTGCNNEMLNTPTKRVEMFLANYQTLNESVMDDLDKVVSEEEQFNADQREIYRSIMKKHYQSITYDIKDEKINGDKATVRTSITVTDYSKVMTSAETYLQEHPEKFQKANKEYDEEKYMDYRLEQMKKAKDTVKYDMNFHLTKKDKIWKMDPLTEEQEQKIHGVYQY